MPTRESLHENPEGFLLTVGGLVALLYAASLVIVSIGQRVIDRQTRAAEEAARREQAWPAAPGALAGARPRRVVVESLAQGNGVCVRVRGEGRAEGCMEQGAELLLGGAATR
jgi:hypothetical protein